MWWVGGSHLGNFWAIWIVGLKEAYVAADIMYVLADAHTCKHFNFQQEMLLHFPNV